MSHKTLAILSYITLFGWLFAFIKSKDEQPKNDLVSYHLEQGLGFILFSVLLNIVLTIIITVVPTLSFLNYVSLILVILWVFAIINAANEQKKPIPLIGGMFENKFNFLK